MRWKCSINNLDPLSLWECDKREEDLLSEEQVRNYLKRLGMDREIPLTKESLDELVYAHQCSIPFETVSIHRGDGVPPADVDALYQKVIDKNLGGYCFELNKLFQELLESLGFDVRPVISRAVRGREGRMPINHRGCVVDLDGKLYSVDVGFGGPMPAGALLLEPGEDQVIADETYAVQPAEDGWLKIERVTRANLDSYDDEVPSRRQVELELCTAFVEEQDFEALNHFFSQPGTLFRDHELANLRLPDGYLGYKDGELTIRRNGQKQVRVFDSAEEADAALDESFGLRF